MCFRLPQQHCMQVSRRKIDNRQSQRRHPPLPAKLRQDLSKSLTHSALRTCLSRCQMGLGDSGDERLVMRNSVAKSIVDSSTVLARNGGGPCNGTAMHRMKDSAWKKARVRAAKFWQEENPLDHLNGLVWDAGKLDVPIMRLSKKRTCARVYNGPSFRR